MNGRLVVAATPIGDVADASPRLRGLLEQADAVAAEDTRRLRRLADRLDVVLGGRVVSYHEHNEGHRTAGLVQLVRDGCTVALVCDAGMPAISDPGYRLIAAVADAGLTVSAIPGASALTTALVVSGLPVDRFCFEGFLPRREGQRRERLRTLAAERRTMVFFEAPHRTAECLADLAALFGSDRRGAVCRELTKTHEEVQRGTLADLVEWARDGIRGEVTLVVAGAQPDQFPVEETLVSAEVDAARSLGLSRRDAVTAVAQRLGMPRRAVYESVHRRDEEPT